jgi:hypothetical protein
VLVESWLHALNATAAAAYVESVVRVQRHELRFDVVMSASGIRIAARLDCRDGILGSDS